MFLFLLAFMVSVVDIIHGEYWNNLHPLAVDNIAMKTTIIAAFVYCLVVMIHERFNSDIGDHYLIISYNIRFLSGTLAVTTLYLIAIQPFGWLLLIIWTIWLVKVVLNLHEPFHNFDQLIQFVQQYQNEDLPH